MKSTYDGNLSARAIRNGVSSTSWYVGGGV